MKSNGPYEAIEWLGLHVEVPRDFQIVRHGISAELGQLTMTDRYAERLNVAWRRIEREPDLDKMVLEQRAKDQATFPSATIDSVRIRGWQGYRVVDTKQTWVRAVKYETRTGQLLEVQLTTHAEYVKCEVLKEDWVSRIAVTDTPEGVSRFAAFDIDVSVPCGLKLTKTAVVPASCTFEFERETPEKYTAKPATAVIRRMAMADTWYRGNPLKLLMRESPNVEFSSPETLRSGPHAATYSEGDTTVARVSRWLGRTSRCRALIVHCEAENAVYHVATSSYDRAPLHPMDLQLRCCKSSGNEGKNS
jgi:hypothetical protein